MGLMFAQELMEDASLPDAPAQTKADWFTLAAWLGQKGERLTDEQQTKFTKAWTDYFALGSAPSMTLQPTFLAFAAELPDKPKVTAPREIIRIFERMLATDEEIRVKHLHDFEKGREVMDKITKAIAEPKSEAKSAGWNVRKLVFWTAAWTLAVFGYAWLADPFDVGGWDELSDDEMARLVAVSLLPLAVAIAVSLYNRWIR